MLDISSSLVAILVVVVGGVEDGVPSSMARLSVTSLEEV